MFATEEQLAEVENGIKYLLNATKVWTGEILDKRRSADAVTHSRRMATMEVLRAIAGNTQHGYWSEIAELVPVAEDSSIPPHDGALGLPWIAPFPGARFRTGFKADPDEIDSYLSDTLGIHSRVDGVRVPHNEADASGMPSPVSGYYSLVNSHFKFTGFRCAIPMICVTEEICDTRLPESLMPTIEKLALKSHYKEGDNLPATAQMLVNDGMLDLQRIQAGAMTTNPVADIEIAQKEI